MRTQYVVCIAAAVLAGVGLIVGSITWAALASREAVPDPPDLIDLAWWQHCVLYQIYPRSFKDSDGDGIGDLQGIISELEHFKDAGVDAIWMSPIFTSPMIDFGYDISDFYSIHHEYGTMEDFEILLTEAHSLGVKVLLDFVPNHASTESEYFKKSVARELDYEDFFIWADPLWVSQFGGSAWEWNEERQQYYLHQFAVEQADFNFRNSRVKNEMLNIMKFWLDKGADGFRVDALPYLIEADPKDHEGRYPDDPLSGLAEFESHQLGYTIPLYTKDLIELYDVVYEWRDFADEYSEVNRGDSRVLFSEGYANISMTMLYYGNDKGTNGSHFPFNFDFITDLSSKSNARDFVYIILKWLTYMPFEGVANWVFGNHDNIECLTFPCKHDRRLKFSEHVVTRCRSHLSGDPARTPYHWDDSTSAGFSKNTSTWLPVAQDYQEINLKKQKEDDRSHFKVYQALTALRKEKTLSHGAYEIKALSDKTLFLVRTLRTHDTLVLLFNVLDVADTISLSRVTHLKLPATVYTASIHSSRKPG
ncbi:hypothetical protein ACJJTC_018993 [Scirpophaga incertulas]